MIAISPGAKYAFSLFMGMCVVYIFLQTFCVPGSGTTLNLLAGCIFAEYVDLGEYLVALPFAVVCSTVGSVSPHAGGNIWMHTVFSLWGYAYSDTNVTI